MDHHHANENHHPSPNVDNDVNVPTFPAARKTTHVEPSATPRGYDIDFPLVATVAITSALLVATIILATQAWFGYELRHELERKSNQVVNLDLRDHQQKQLANIDSYRWVDNNQKIVTLPIHRAMELTVEHYKNNRTQALESK